MDRILQHVELAKQYLPEVKIVFNWKDATKVAGGVIVAFSVIYAGKIWYAQKFFKRRGIKTPDTIKFMSGNYHEIVQNSFSDQLRNWTRKLGPMYGYYEGHLPILVTSDPDFVQEVFVKQYANFMARKRPPLQVSEEDPKSSLFQSTRGRWKRMRNIINPTFSTAKLKDLLPLITMCSDRLLETIENNLEKEINIKKYLGQFTMDTICNCAFGLDIDCLKNPNNPFLVNSVSLFDNATSYQFGLLYLFYFYEFKRVWVAMQGIKQTLSSLFGISSLSNPILWLRGHIDQLITHRLKNNVSTKDYMQILLESQSEQIDTSNDTSNQDLNQAKLEKKMTLDEIKLNLVGFMLAGYDTTSNALSYAMHILTTHPDELAKLQDEIDAKFSPDSDIPIDYDSVTDLPYMEMFIKETLRMYPLANNVVNRRCISKCTIKGVEIPKDLVVAVDVMSIHFSPDLWGPVDPNTFYPLRFSPEIKRHQCAFLPFGTGPRTCVGMKFAMVEIKMALTKILLKYTVHPSPNTKRELELEEGPAVRRAKHGIPVIFKKREL